MSEEEKQQVGYFEKLIIFWVRDCICNFCGRNCPKILLGNCILMRIIGQKIPIIRLKDVAGK